MPATEKLSPAWSLYSNKELLFKKKKKKNLKKHDRDKAQWLNLIRRFFHNLTCLFQRHQFVKCRRLFAARFRKRETNSSLFAYMFHITSQSVFRSGWIRDGLSLTPVSNQYTACVSFDSSCHKNRKALGTQKIHLPQVKVRISPKPHHRKPFFCSISCSSLYEFQFPLNCIWFFLKNLFPLQRTQRTIFITPHFYVTKIQKFG